MKHVAVAAVLVAAVIPHCVLAHSEEQPEAPQAIDCRQPAAGTVTALPAPIDRWARVECTPSAQYLVPDPGWVWRYPASFTTPVLIPAWTPDPSKAAAQAHYFVSVEVAHATGEAAHALHQRMADAVAAYAASAGTAAREVYTLRAQNNVGGHFDIHFMVRSDRDVWALVCAPDCGPELSFVMHARSN